MGNASRFRRALLSGTFAVLLLVLSACSLPANPPPIVKIGLVAPFEGLGRPYGYALLPAVKLAVADANASGELGPYKATLVALNDDGWATGAEAQARAVAQDPEVMAVLGPWEAATAQAAAPVYAANGLPALVFASVDRLPAGVLSACPGSAELARQMVARAGKTGTGTAGADGPDNELGRALQAAGAGQAVPAGTWLYSGDAAAAADDLTEAEGRDLHPMLVGGPDVLRSWLPQRAGQAAEGSWAPACVLAGQGSQQGLPANFAGRYQAEAGALPGPEALLAYSGARALLRALAADIRSHGHPTHTGVATALQAQPLSPSLSWYQVRNGKWIAP